MSSFLKALAPILVAIWSVVSAAAEPNALAQLGAGGAVIDDKSGAVEIRVALSQAVPWRVHLLNGPPRVALEFGELRWSEAPDVRSASVTDVMTERHDAGWSRMVALLQEPLDVETAEMTVAEGGSAQLVVTLVPVTAEDFREAAEENTPLFAAKGAGKGLPVITIDPGHGGRDPGAQADGLSEADLMLDVARRLKDDLIRTGRYDVVLTRDEDVFVPLEQRLTMARDAGAHLFLSLHADALAEDAGSASGVTLYTLSPDAEADAADTLTERHDGTNVLTGVDLTDAGDDVTLALLDLARQDSVPRSDALTKALIAAFQSSGLALNSRPHRQADLSVLKSAGTPSVLVELGFLSSVEDRERLNSEEWRASASLAIRDAILLWSDEDRLLGEGFRR
ncbi:MAG: N-acetylmuramoyl-L-alanine amidase [Silicimonas sp.]|nr:N-acetylmuramoyl-L-alanine amidase [Silicimonas sp.]